MPGQKINIWCLKLIDIPLSPMEALLSEKELARANRFVFEPDRERFIKTRGALRTILAKALGGDAKKVEILQERGKKPILAMAPLPCHFNVSHSKDYALIGLASVPIGVDIEQLKPTTDWPMIAKRYFHPREMQMIENQPGDEQQAVFFQLWTHKEAYLKAIGIGLARDPSSFYIPLQGGPVIEEKPKSTIWYTNILDAPTGYKASLTSTEENSHITYSQTPLF